MKKSSSKLIGAFLVLLVITTGCASSAAQAMPTSAPTDTQPPPTLAPTATPAPPTPRPTSPFLGNFPVGNYTKIIVDGVATWRFYTDGTYSFHTQMDGTETGSFTVIGEQISINDTDFIDCKGVTGTYTWSYKDNALLFNLVDDPCEWRQAIVPVVKWKKEP